MLADNSRPGEEKEKLLLLDLQHLIVLLRNDVDVISAAKNELRHLPQHIWWRRSHRVSDNSVQRRLHRAGWNFERLQKIGTNPDRDHDGDENDFDILAPVRFPRHRCQLVQFGIELFGAAFDLFSIALFQRRMQPPIMPADFVVGRRVREHRVCSANISAHDASTVCCV